jgi:hypothetical protein
LTFDRHRLLPEIGIVIDGGIISAITNAFIGDHSAINQAMRLRIAANACCARMDQISAQERSEYKPAHVRLGQ